MTSSAVGVGLPEIQYAGWNQSCDHLAVDVCCSRDGLATLLQQPLLYISIIRESYCETPLFSIV